jgi:hypothetical protein
MEEVSIEGPCFISILFVNSLIERHKSVVTDLWSTVVYNNVPWKWEAGSTDEGGGYDFICAVNFLFAHF